MILLGGKCNFIMLKLIHIYTNIFLKKNLGGPIAPHSQCMPPSMGVPLGIVDSNCHRLDLVPPLHTIAPSCLGSTVDLGGAFLFFFFFLFS